MHVLSLFSWIECARIAFDIAWITPGKYFSSEVDPYATRVVREKYPVIDHIGDVKNIHYNSFMGTLVQTYFEKGIKSATRIWNVPIDILIGWPPCQDLSIAKKNRKWLEWEKSNLFFEYLRLLKEVRPKYFIMENVASMSQENRKIITDHLLEAYPDTVCHKINSNIYGAQNRKRLFWTNIQGYIEPEDRGILLRDILEDIHMDDPRWRPLEEKYLTDKMKLSLREKSLSIAASYHKKNAQNYFNKWDGKIIIGQFRRGAYLRIHSDQDKSPTLTSNMGTGGNNVPVILGIFQLPRWKNNWGIVADGEKSPTLTTWQFEHNNKLMADREGQYFYRKLTCIECERLMNIPDNYTACLSNSRRYHAIWNAFDPAIIADFLKLIK